MLQKPEEHGPFCVDGIDYDQSGSDSESESDSVELEVMDPDVQSSGEALLVLSMARSRRVAAARSGLTTLPIASRFEAARSHHASASGRSASFDRIVQSNSFPMASGSV